MNKKGNSLPIFGCCFRLMISIFWPSSHDFSHQARSSYIWIHRVAGNNVLRYFHHQELCQLKAYVLYSSQKGYIFSPAIVLMSACSAYLEFLSQFIAQLALWNSLSLLPNQDYLGSSLKRGYLTWTVSHRLNRLAFANCFLNYWNGLEWPKSFLPNLNFFAYYTV